LQIRIELWGGDAENPDRLLQTFQEEPSASIITKSRKQRQQNMSKRWYPFTWLHDIIICSTADTDALASFRNPKSRYTAKCGSSWTRGSTCLCGHMMRASQGYAHPKGNTLFSSSRPKMTTLTRENRAILWRSGAILTPKVSE